MGYLDTIDQFKGKNASVEVEDTEDVIIIRKPWDDNTLILKVSKDKFESFQDVVLYKEFAALYDDKTCTFEFFFDLIKPESKLVGRSFNFMFRGNTYHAEYNSPSPIFEIIVKSAEKIDDESETDYRNLMRFKSYYETYDEPKKDGMRIPINFYLQGEGFRSLNDKERIELFKHVNFYMTFYDRDSPYILILDEDRMYTGGKHSTPTLQFPSIINATQIDTTLLDLFQTARTTQSVRLKYLFYYQVLEYCSYYYLKDDLRHKLKNIVKKPDLLNNPDYYTQKLIDELKDSLKNERDEYQMEKLISSYCCYADVKNELKTNADYFTKDLDFNGGFVLKKLFNNSDEIEKPHPDVMKSIKERIDKLRNVLVHVRESRENKVILPTRHNTDLLVPYMHLIRRIAEVVAYSHE